VARATRTRWRWIAGAAVVGAIGLLASAPAAAEPAHPAPEPPEVEDARDAYRLGISLIKQGQWSDALAAFERSLRLRPDGVTAFNVGYCERALGRFTRARKSFLQALASPELPADKGSEARGYLAEIESRLARAVTTLSPAGASVAVDGRPLEAASPDQLVAGTRDPGPAEAVRASSFTLVLDPGTHVIMVSAPGLPDAVLTRQLAPGATTTLALAPGPAAPVIAPPAPVAAKPAVARSPQRTGALVAFGVGGVAAVTGVVFGALALKDKGALDGVCPQMDRCAVGSQGTIDAMKTFSTVSTTGLVAGAAGLATGTILLLAGDTQAPRGAPALSIGPTGAWVRGAF